MTATLTTTTKAYGERQVSETVTGQPFKQTMFIDRQAAQKHVINRINELREQGYSVSTK